jgi:hypothetical protein
MANNDKSVPLHNLREISNRGIDLILRAEYALIFIIFNVYYGAFNDTEFYVWS